MTPAELVGDRPLDLGDLSLFISHMESTTPGQLRALVAEARERSEDARVTTYRRRAWGALASAIEVMTL